MHAVEWIEQHGRFRRIIGAQDLRNALQRQKGKCTWCGGSVPKGRSTWCSGECVDGYMGRCSPSHIRYKVEQRDKGVCAACGRDTRELQRLIHRIVYGPRDAYRTCERWCHRGCLVNRRGSKNKRRLKRYRALTRTNWSGVYGKHALSEWMKRNGWGSRPSGDLWEADHIVPVVEGGGLTTIENYRTLCLPCHKRATAELAGRRAKPNPQKQEPRERQKQLLGEP